MNYHRFYKIYLFNLFCRFLYFFIDSKCNSKIWFFFNLCCCKLQNCAIKSISQRICSLQPTILMKLEHTRMPISQWFCDSRHRHIHSFTHSMSRNYSISEKWMTTPKLINRLSPVSFLCDDFSKKLSLAFEQTFQNDHLQSVLSQTDI